MKTWVREWFISFILRWIAIGGHCGYCGRWVPDCLVASYWRVTICDECVALAAKEG